MTPLRPLSDPRRSPFTAGRDRRALALAASLVAVATAATAQDAPPSDTRPAPPRWEAGATLLLATQWAYPGSDENLDRVRLLPYAVYRGPVLRVEGGGAGVRALATPRLELDLGVSGAFGGGANEVAARRGMPAIGTRIEVGPRLRLRLGDLDGPQPPAWRLDLPLRAVLDVSRDFQGAGTVFEPSLAWSARPADGWTLGADVGATFADRRFNATLYQVRPQDVLPGRPAYTARAGLVSTQAGLSVSRRVAERWRLFARLRVESVAGAANADSPLVRRDTGASFTVGAVWRFAESDDAGND